MVQDADVVARSAQDGNALPDAARTLSFRTGRLSRYQGHAWMPRGGRVRPARTRLSGARPVTEEHPGHADAAGALPSDAALRGEAVFAATRPRGAARRRAYGSTRRAVRTTARSTSGNQQVVSGWSPRPLPFRGHAVTSQLNVAKRAPTVNAPSARAWIGTGLRAVADRRVAYRS